MKAAEKKRHPRTFFSLFLFSLFCFFTSSTISPGGTDAGSVISGASASYSKSEAAAAFLCVIVYGTAGVLGTSMYELSCDWFRASMFCWCWDCDINAEALAGSSSTMELPWFKR